MKTKLTVDKSNKIEVYFDKLSLNIRSLPKLDSLMSSLKSKALVINTDYLSDMTVIKYQRNSSYKLIGSVDHDCNLFGTNKIFKLQNLIEADGFDIGLTNNQNTNDLLNEIKGINNFLKLSGKQYEIRLMIDTEGNYDHIFNCIEAIKKSNIRYNMICIKNHISPINILEEITKECRKALGKPKEKIKIYTRFNENVINDKDLNLIYQFKADELV